MKLTQLRQLVPGLLRRGRSVKLVGAPGTAKSSFVETEIPLIAKEVLGWDDFNIITFQLNCVESPDIGGFQIPAKHVAADGTATWRTESTVPGFMPRPDDPKRGLVFFDERSQAGQDVLKAVAPVILDGRAGSHQLPPGYVRWSASNRMADRAGCVKEPMHLINRELHIPIEMDAPGWCEWYARQPVNHFLFAGYARFQPAAVFSESVPVEPEPYSTARSYYECSLDMMEFTNGDIEGQLCGEAQRAGILSELAIGALGKSTASMMLAYMKIASELRTFEDIMADPTGIKIPSGRRDICFSYMMMLNQNINAENAEQCFKFAATMPKEFQVASVKEMLAKTRGTLLNHPLFAKWVSENSALIQCSMI